MDWQSEIEGFSIRSIDLYLKYHIQGKLEGLKLTLYIDEGHTDIILKVNSEAEPIDFDCFEVVSEDCERDAQRECYFENESLWFDFFDEMDGEMSRISKIMESVCNKLHNHYRVCVEFECLMA